MSDPIKINYLIFNETMEVNDSVAYIANSYIAYYIEKMTGRAINDKVVTNIEPFMQNKKRGKHPRSILEKTHPTLSLSYMPDDDPTERALSTSQLTTPIRYLSPTITGDKLLENSDKTDLSKNIEVILQWSDTELNCDVAVVEETYALQTNSRRAWDTLFEKDKEYSMFAEIKFPISDEVFNYWCDTFGLDKNDLDAVLKHMQERSDTKLTREVNHLRQREQIHIRIPMEILFAFGPSDIRTDNEQDYTAGAYIVHRTLNLRYNSPRMYWINPKERYPWLHIDTPKMIDKPGEIEVDRVNDTYTKNGVVFTARVHKTVFFEKDVFVYTLLPFMDDWFPFLEWCFKQKIPYSDAIYILIRENNKVEQSSSYVSTDKIAISYKEELLIKLLDKNMVNKSFDVKIYINLMLFEKFSEYKEQFIFTDYESIIDTADRGEVKLSDELLAKING
jgi:hypothetical protein|nr:MAG TPA: hypothetical protein [Caudoviricetes sp.]